MAACGDLCEGMSVKQEAPGATLEAPPFESGEEVTRRMARP
jgi:hypothetical protein